MRAFTPYAAFATLPGEARRRTVLVVARVSAECLRTFASDGRTYDLPATAVGRPRRSAAARVQAAHLTAEYGRLRALLRDLGPHSRGRRP